MNRTEYLETEDGQRNELRKRRAKRQHFVLSDHEPKSKNSMEGDEKIAFQQQILNSIKQFGRRAYRSPVVLEIDFNSHQNDPPAIHTLAKNYMDLLQKPIYGSDINRNSLLLTDDRQIDILIVNYHLRQFDSPEVCLQVDTVANFAQDLILLDRIRYHNFRNTSDYDLDSIWDEDSVGNRHNCLCDPIQELRELEGQRPNIVARFGIEAYDGMRRMNLMQAQEFYLEAFGPKVQNLLSLLRPLISGGSGMEQMQAQMRDMIMTPPLMLDLTHTPVNNGGRSVFKTNVRNALRDFKASHPLLFPLLQTVGVTILCVPPKSQSADGKEQYVDLDNLARYVIPAVHEVLKPPASTVHTFDVTAMTDEHCRKYFEDCLERLKRTPKCSVTQYQIIRLPRLAGDPENGLVRLALSSGKSYEGLWRQMDEIIRRWREIIA